jgi:FtsH-binding integral membrane protein
VIKRWQAEAGTMPGGGMDEVTFVRLSVLGALKLYLDMLNLFLFLLRLGRR